MRKFLLTLPLLFLTSSLADEGMWQPHQLPALNDRLMELGLEIDPENLSSLDKFPMNAVVSLGGCSASFVSPSGLVVTNHHCVYGSIQYNSSPDNNLLVDGFLARNMEDEVRAAPGSRVYVTEEVTDVTDRARAGVTDDMSGIARYQTIENNRKAIIADCESTGMHRCGVSSFHQGLEYFLIKRLEIRDVRLVYVPATSIGKYGGDIDNWQWPRHTGDFGFYRAYVDQNGMPADYSEDNVPYQSDSFLEISRSGVESGDFVMGVGYPGSTNRYRTVSEIENQFNWFYPNARQMREDIVSIINENTEPGSQARLAYENTLASLNNYAKNYQSMVESYQNSDFIDRQRQFELDLSTWINSDDERSERYSRSVLQLDALIEENQESRERNLVSSYMSYATLPTTAQRLYRLAIERQKPDAEREPGYQERDMRRFTQSMQSISRRYDETVDKAILSYMLGHYADLPEQHRSQSLDAFYQIGTTFNQSQVNGIIDDSYSRSALADEATRLAWIESSVEEFQASDDPFIQYAVASHAERMALELAGKELSGQFQQSRPQYMEAVIAYNRSLGQPIYADANSSLRVTFGKVQGNEPRDGLVNLPFTTLEGILGKDTGLDPFNAPQKQLDLIRAGQYGAYELDSIGSVPVNFLADLDITGGNSGTAAMNSKAQLVGLLFDGVYESIIGDWDFDQSKNRAIAVDSRYMLWVMEYMDNASNLLEEMTIVD
ncbi:MAG: S46 family peptidase [Gammaproteobacteria bacterium]|nr:S46 family peptidase [Gammaproteobacteria bacterium]MDD9959771.1 S46 family peptidase [Gammaproteobacteria bacterium]